MNVLLISECSGRALTETRRILDQFAERRGERTWQTAITQEGLKTLQRLLRKTARKNTAVACHWIRGLDHSEFLWSVGNASRFSLDGSVPTNTTQRNLLRAQDENDWLTGETIYLLSSLAALLHDLGKACLAFQDRLKASVDGAWSKERNLYRHEWVSVRLFQAFVGDDDDLSWLQRLQNPSTDDDARWLVNLIKDQPDIKQAALFETMGPLAQAIAWLVLTHHRLPEHPELRREPRPLQTRMFENMLSSIRADWNEQCSETDPVKIKPYWTFPCGLPVTVGKWRNRAARLARRLIDLRQRGEPSSWLDSPYVMHLARLSLMLGDHYYSSLGAKDHSRRTTGDKDYPLAANTARDEHGVVQFNQPLDEHLLGVALQCGHIVHGLYDMQWVLPRLARHRGMKKRATQERFRWQDKAFDLVSSIRGRAQSQGAFFVNMASTGCGKTIANARIMYALADPRLGARFSIALGLQVLTRQTGLAYQSKLSLGDDELAIRVGGSTNQRLFEHYQIEAEAMGSESTQDLMPEDGSVLFEGNFDEHPVLQRLSDKARSLIAAPVLACTVDHLMPATESHRGGRQIAPMLRLMSSDLILDEVDDFGLKDLYALARLVHWAGMLGSRVMLSSATLPPSLVQGLFDAYIAGRTQYQRNHGDGQAPINICCGWFDEHQCDAVDCADTSAFSTQHQTFATSRAERLSQDVVRRVAQLQPVDLQGVSRPDIRQQFAANVLASALTLHSSNHVIDTDSGKAVSFGLVRMANVEPIIDVALALYKLGVPEGFRVHLCVYHSRYPLFVRSEIEARLDAVLNRSIGGTSFEHPAVRQCLDHNSEANQLFIILGSPVTEVGRDHDYDWAVVEPSSMRSLIQLAGRVRRHRPEPWSACNIHVLRRNVKSWEAAAGRPVFIRPGFEAERRVLRSRDLIELLREEDWQHIDARPRILERASDVSDWEVSLVGLEHKQMRRIMVPDLNRPKLGAHSWWTAGRATLTLALQQKYPFREQSVQEIEIVFLPDEDEGHLELHRIDERRGQEPDYIKIEKSKHQLISDEDVQGVRISAWGITGHSEYLEALLELSRELDISVDYCAKRYGTVRVIASEGGWRFHPALGFGRAQQP